MRQAVLLGTVVCLLCGPLFGVDRDAFTFTDYNLEIRIEPATSGFAASGKVRLRNEGGTPQRLAVMQVSSSLDWKKITVGGKPVQWQAQPYVSDIDHTGSVSEAIVTLPQAVVPGGTAEIEVSYAGKVALDTTRLERIGLPRTIAEATDWDQIGAEASAVRGLGYVVWYPVAMESVSLSNANEVFDAIARWQERQSGARLHVTIAIAGAASILDNSTIPEGGCPKDSGLIGGVVMNRTHCVEYRIGRSTPVFVIGKYARLAGDELEVDYLPERVAAAHDYARFAKAPQVLCEQWFGRPKEAARLIDLEPLDAASFDAGPTLFAPLKETDSKSLQLAFAHLFAHAALDSPRPWIYEGAAHFAQVLERESQDGRGAAIDYMGQFLPAIQALEKPAAAPGEGREARAAAPPGGQPLVATTDEIFYRSKAMYVWWMLRDMVGDAALEEALKSYRAADDKDPTYFQRLLEAQAHRSLQAFFDDWVYNDRGFPDFRIASAFPTALMAGGYTVTVTVENLGRAGAEVPVTVRAVNGQRVRRAMVPGKGKAVLHLEVSGKPLEATVNDGSVPESDMTNNTLAISVPAQ